MWGVTILRNWGGGEIAIPVKTAVNTGTGASFYVFPTAGAGEAIVSYNPLIRLTTLNGEIGVKGSTIKVTGVSSWAEINGISHTCSLLDSFATNDGNIFYRYYVDFLHKKYRGMGRYYRWYYRYLVYVSPKQQVGDFVGAGENWGRLASDALSLRSINHFEKGSVISSDTVFTIEGGKVTDYIYRY